MKLNSLILLLSSAAVCAVAQSIPPKTGDFVFPVRRGQENYLSGTVGELRRTHFHMGIDIKTSGTTGLPIYATADGYIQRIRINTNGYGNALYMAHPQNETVSVYAHLKSFDPAIAAYARSEQYSRESFDVNLFPKKSQFRFLQGDIIGYSGNSGSSAGPHLHFEIRTNQHLVLDPLKYGFDEIDDTVAPTLEKVAFETKDINARVNGQFGRHEFDVIKMQDGSFQLNGSVYLQGLIGVEVYAYDKFDRAKNKNGILDQSLTLDDNEVFVQQMDSLQFAHAKHILIHTNYPRSVQGGRRFNKMYIDDGNDLDFFRTGESKGMLNIHDPLEHKLQIRLADSYGNIAQYIFNINTKDNEVGKSRVSSTYDNRGYDLIGNYLAFKTNLANHGYCEAMIYESGKTITCQLAYDEGDLGHYLWDLRDGLPDSIEVCNEKYYFDFSAMVASANSSKWQDEHIAIDFPTKCLFDTAYLRYKYERIDKQEYFRFKNRTTPFRRNFYVTLNPFETYDKNKSAVYSVSSEGTLNYLGGEWQNDVLKFKSRDLVDYTIAADLEPPKVNYVNRRANSLRFKIDDTMSGISNFRAELNGKWLLMSYDHKTKLLWTDPQVVIKGHFKLTVTDNAENSTVFEMDY